MPPNAPVLNNNSLSALRHAFEAAYGAFEAVLSDHFPGATKWDWYRAVAALRGENCRRNEDRSRDEAMAADVSISRAHDEFIRLLHVFYRARDGERGVLGSR